MATLGQKYTDWRLSQSSAYADNQYPIVARQMNSAANHVCVPPRYERGRTLVKSMYTNQPATYEHFIMQPQSRSASGVEKKHQDTPLKHHKLYTKAHYMRIKQPFSGKHIAAPMTRYAEDYPMRQYIKVTPSPQHHMKVYAQPQQPVLAGQVRTSNIFHVQYRPGPNQTVHKGPMIPMGTSGGDIRTSYRSTAGNAHSLLVEDGNALKRSSGICYSSELQPARYVDEQNGVTSSKRGDEYTIVDYVGKDKAHTNGSVAPSALVKEVTHTTRKLPTPT